MRVGLRGTLTVMAAGCLVTAIVGQRTPGLLLWLAAIETLLLMLARRWPGPRAALLFAFVTTVSLYLMPAAVWPAPLALAVLAFSIVTRSSALAWRGPWCRLGRLDLRSTFLILLIIPLSAAALLIWFGSAGPKATAAQHTYRSLVQDRPIGFVIAAGLAFAAVNGAAEELAFNGIVQTALAEHQTSLPPVVIGAIAFGAAHYAGFPSGVLGVLLATCYGLVLSGLRLMTGGLLAPWIAHMFADVTIVALVITAPCSLSGAPCPGVT